MFNVPNQSSQSARSALDISAADVAKYGVRPTAPCLFVKNRLDDTIVVANEDIIQRGDLVEAYYPTAEELIAMGYDARIVESIVVRSNALRDNSSKLPPPPPRLA